MKPIRLISFMLVFAIVTSFASSIAQAQNIESEKTKAAKDTRLVAISATSAVVSLGSGVLLHRTSSSLSKPPGLFAAESKMNRAIRGVERDRNSMRSNPFWFFGANDMDHLDKARAAEREVLALEGLPVSKARKILSPFSKALAYLAYSNAVLDAIQTAVPYSSNVNATGAVLAPMGFHQRMSETLNKSSQPKLSHSNPASAKDSVGKSAGL